MILFDLKVISPLSEGRVETITRVIHENGGSQPFLAFREEGFYPAFYLVFGDSFQDAYDNFICDEKLEETWKMDDQEMAEWLADPKNDPNEGTPAGYSFNDNGNLVETDLIHLVVLSWDDLTHRPEKIKVFREEHLFVPSFI